MAGFIYNKRKMRVEEDRYYTNGQLAILVFDEDDNEFYGVLTVNLDDPRCDLINNGLKMQYLDVNNWPNIEEILADYLWLEKTDISKQSGYVNYPLYMFDLSK